MASPATPPRAATFLALDRSGALEKPPSASDASVSEVTVRPLRECDLAEAKRIFHLAFGTFLGLPDPAQCVPDRDLVVSRWRKDPASALAAEWNSALVGSNFATFWGTVGFFGPLTIRPDLWNRRVAQRLLEPTLDLFRQRGARHTGLFTFSHSEKHIHLYQKFGFWPRFLTPVMSLTLRSSGVGAEPDTFCGVATDQREACLAASFELTDAIYEGLDVRNEIRAVADQRLGDTVLLWDNSRLAGLAVCHCGVHTEAGRETCYVKFAMARSASAFEALLDACENFARRCRLGRLVAGVNTARHDAYRRLIARGFRTDLIGVAMHQGNDPGYSRPEVYALDDWR